MRRNVLEAVLWVFLEALVKNLLLFAFTVALARLLTPADFGVVAMLSLFVGVASALAEGGMGAALIQSKNPTQTDVSTLFWTQLGLAVLLGSALAASGPTLGTLFHQDILAPLAIAYGVNLIVSAPASVQTSLFIKKLQFRTPTLVALGAQTIAGLTAVAAAVHGAGPWALVAQAITGSAVTTLMLWRLSPWRPSFAFSQKSLRRHAGFGIYVVGAGILGEIEQRVGSLVVGRFGGAADAGQFQRGSGTQLLLARLLSGVITRVAFPAFAAIQEDTHRLTNAVREAVFVNFAATALAMWMVALLAEPLVRLVFGAAWMPSVPVLQALCLAGGFYPIFAVFSKTLRAIGRARAVFMQHAVRAAGVSAIAYLFRDLGFTALAWAQAVFLICAMPMGSVGVARWAGYQLKSQMADLLPIVVSGVVMAIAGLTVDRVMASFDDIPRLIAVGGAAAGAYVGSLLIWILLLPTPAAGMASRTICSFLRGARLRGEV